MNIYPWQKNLFAKLAGSAMPHALLLCGRSGIGKYDFAMSLAGLLLCEKPGKTACGKCPSCLWFSQGTHPDFRLIEPEALSDDEGKKQITVDEIRALADFVNLSSHRSGYRVIVIHPAEAMNAHAANSLLKTLEEPPPKTIFLLVTHKVQKLLPTILSRCQSVPMPFPTHEESGAWLKAQGVENPEALLAEAGFAPLTAFAASNEKDEIRSRFLLEMENPAQLNPIELAEAMQKSELSKIVLLLQKWCHDLGCSQFAQTVRYYPERAARIGEIAHRIDPVELMKFNRQLLQVQKTSSHPLNPKLFIESLFWSYLDLLRGRATK